MKKRFMCLCLVVALVVGLFVGAPIASAAEDTPTDTPVDTPTDPPADTPTDPSVDAPTDPPVDPPEDVPEEMKSSEELIAAIKQFEGFSGTPYLDTDGLYTIGYGTRCPADKVEQYMQTPMTKEEADAELRDKLVTYETEVNRFIKRHGLTYEQRQFDGVVSLVFNCGTSWLTKGGTLIRALSSGAEGNELICAFSIYSLSNGVRSLGHVRRRLAEANIYLNGVYDFNPPDNYGYVLYDALGGTIQANNGTYNVQGYDTNLTAAPIATASKTGYFFKGWSLVKNGVEPVEVLDATTKNATLYAIWEADPNYVPPVDPEPSDPPNPPIPEPPNPEDGTPITPITVTVVTNGVNLREGPGLDYAVVGSTNKGAQYSIVATYENDGYFWGKFHSGWIALSFTDYERPIVCDHAYTVTSQQAASCTADGHVTHTCGKCGNSYTETIPAKGHDFGNASCTEARTCKTCGMTQGAALGHKYADATCTKPQTCTVCGATKGEVLGHKYDAATCTKPQTCTVCGATKGEALGHKYDAATCTKPQTCKACGATKGEALGHKYDAATCTKPQTCTVCGGTKGEALGHQYSDATCTAPQKCTVCGEIHGTALGHAYDKEGLCSRCGQGDPEYEVIITKVFGTIYNTDSQNVRDVPDGVKVGALKRGDRVEILEQKTVAGRLWGRYSGGWICMRSCVKLETVTEVVRPYAPTNPPVVEPNPPVVEPNPPVVEPDPPVVEPPVTVTKTFGTVIKTDTLNVRQTPDGKTVGVLRLGDRVEILEQKMVAGRLWGRYSGGWICMRSYVKLETVTETVNPKPPVVEPEPPVVEPNPPVVEPPVTVTKTFGTVIKTSTLNVRQTPDGKTVGVLRLGDRVEILEQKMVDGRLWGRYSGGWICMRSYVKLETVTETVQPKPPVTEPEPPVVDPEPPVVDPKPPVTVTKTYGTIINTDSQNVRSAPDGVVVGKLYCGDKVEILEQKMFEGRLWGRYSGGWICMRSYVKLETVTETVQQETGKVKADRLNVRAGAGTTYEVVGQLAEGTTVVILEKKTVDGTVWGRIEQGWISMDYIV